MKDWTNRLHGVVTMENPGRDSSGLRGSASPGCLPEIWSEVLSHLGQC